MVRIKRGGFFVGSSPVAFPSHNGSDQTGKNGWRRGGGIKFPSHNGSDQTTLGCHKDDATKRFHPTMVRIKQCMYLTNAFSLNSFHPTMVRIKLLPGFWQKSWELVSIPQWFGSNALQEARKRGIYSFHPTMVRIKLYRETSHAPADSFHPTMVRIKLKKEKGILKLNGFPSHNGSDQTWVGKLESLSQ